MHVLKPLDRPPAEPLTSTSEFSELVTPFLREKMRWLAETRGEQSPEYMALSRQYLRGPEEDQVYADETDRHYHADAASEPGNGLVNVERLYRRSLVIEITMACAAHCRYCLRANYPKHTLSEDEIIAISRYCGSPPVSDELQEVLVTGGDALLLPHRLGFLVDALIRYAPNVRVMRIATRLPQHSPQRIDNNVYRVFQKQAGVRFELATQTNHPIELSFPETLDVFRRLRDLGVAIYSQNVLLRGVNDDLDTLVELYDRMRGLEIEPHYLFHCIPLRGMRHLRTTVDEGLELTKRLVASGRISGRTKPMYAAMTDVGKITFYEGVIVERDLERNRLLLQSHYTHEERLRWNPDWKVPENASIDDQGYLRVWYLDGPSKNSR